MVPQTMRLFDDTQRHYVGHAYHSEPMFSFLNRSAHPEAGELRRLLEQWFEQYPESGKQDLRQRFRSDDDEHHLGAFFELYCHTLLTCQGFTVELHPRTTQGNAAHPDFLVRQAGTRQFYLECTVLGDSAEDRAGQARLDQLYDALSDFDSHDFLIGIELKTFPERSLPAAPLRQFLEQKLQDLDVDELAQTLQSQGLEALPHWQYSDGPWQIEIFPLPKPQDVRGRVGIPPVSLTQYGVRLFDWHERLRRKISAKAPPHGRSDLPYLIAVDAVGEMGMMADEDDIDTALFGRHQYRCLLRSGEVVGGYWTRARDGLWFGPKGPRYKGISGVLAVLGLVPWTVNLKTPVLWHNPWASKALDHRYWQGPQKALDLKGRCMRTIDGRHAEDILGLVTF